MKKLITVFAIAAQFLATALANVGDKADFSALGHTDFIQGNVTAADLDGKVIILEYWGVNCGPCRAAMPGLQALWEKHKGNGLVIIGTELQRTPHNRVKEYVTQNKLTFPICSGFWLPQGQIQGGLPTTVLIGANGKVVKIGRPREIEPLVEEELKKLKKGVPLADGIQFKKYKKFEKLMVPGTPDLEGKIAELRDKDDEEARAICAAFDAWLESAKKRVAALQETDALEFIAKAVELRKMAPSVTEFSPVVKAIKADPAYERVSELNKTVRAAQAKADDGKPLSPATAKKTIKALEAIHTENAALQGSVTRLLAQSKDLLALAERTAEDKKNAKKNKKK